MKFTKLLVIIVALTALLLLSLVVQDLYFKGDMDESSSDGTLSEEMLLQYEWPQLQGDSSFTRFSEGPAPEAPDILWKTNITGIQSYVSAFNGEHICCAISDKKCLEGYKAKKQWLSDQFADGYVFKKGDVRGKVFIEYVPVERAWCPIDAPKYMLINCFWVSGQYKGKGHGKALYKECVKDSRGKNGIIVITGKKKQPFMSEKKFFKKQGFELC